MNINTVLLVLLALLDLVCIIAVIFVERKNPSSTIAWILVLIFFPIGGFLAYALFGSGFHVNKKKRYALKKVSDSLYRQLLSKYIAGCETCPPVADQPHARLIQYLQNDGDYYLTQDNGVRIFTDGESMFEAMKRDMRHAHQHIHLLYYIIQDDWIGREVLSILSAKARAGVEVRLIYDSLGSFLSNDKMFRELRAAGGKVEAFSPLISNLNSHFRLNYRNHRKITVVDGLIGYVGGMNIGDEYLGLDKRLTPWRDTHLRLTGSSVCFLQERFFMDWMSVNDKEWDVIKERELTTEQMRPYFPRPMKSDTIGVQIVSSGPDTPEQSIKSGLLEMIYSARKTVFIQTPYFIPDDSFLDALKITARAGVDVRLMIPAMCDHYLVHCATMSYARQTLEAGVKVYAYTRGFLHAKAVVCDGNAASIGTANLDNRSFALNFEINAFIYGKDIGGECESIFLRDLQHCTEITEEWYIACNPFLRNAYSASRLMAPLI